MSNKTFNYRQVHPIPHNIHSFIITINNAASIITQSFPIRVMTVSAKLKFKSSQSSQF